MSVDVRTQREKKRREAREEIARRHPGLRDVITEFQPDAVEIEQRSIPGGARWTLYTVFALIAAFCIWAYWAEVDKIVESHGKFVVEQLITVQTASTAPIRTIEVQFGETVESGQLLATLDPTFSDADVAQLEAQLESETAHFQRLQAESNNEPFSISGHEESLAWNTQYTAFLERQKEYQAKLAEFASEKEKVVVQQSNNLIEKNSQEDLLTTIRELYETNLRLFEKNSVAKNKLMEIEVQLKSTESKVLIHQGKENELAAELERLDTQTKAYVASWKAQVAKDLTDTSKMISDIEQNLNKARRAQELVEIRVPTNTPYEKFYVLEVAERSVGSVVQPGEPLFKLVPRNAPLEVEVDIAGKDVGVVKVGDRVRLKLNSFPYQRYGFLSGEIRTISEDSFEKETSPGMPPISTYRARVSLTDESHLVNVPENFKPMPGMTVNAEVKVGKQRVYEYFLYPLIRALGESIREP